MLFNEKIQNIYSRLLDLITVFRKVNATDIITIPNKIAEMVIGENKLSLRVCKTIQEISAEDLTGVITIQSHSFYKCSDLSHVEIPLTVIKIEVSAFYACTGLINLTIPESVSYIGDFAFDSCSSLTDIYLKPITPPTLGINAIPSITTIHVPIGSGDAYKSATNWSSYASQIVEDIEI